MDKITFSLTISKELNNWLKQEASNLGVSKNAQVIFFLEQIRKSGGIIEQYIKSKMDEYEPL